MSERIVSFKMHDGTLEALKWLALISMTVDHANRFFNHGFSTSAYTFGRIAMPLFAFIFAYNCAREHFSYPEDYLKISKRLLISGLFSILPYRHLQHLTTFFPLNIMFMFFAFITVLYLIESKHYLDKILAIIFFFMSGFFVEYNWIGILLCLSFWVFLKKPSISTLLFIIFTFFGLEQINNNLGGWFSLPLIIGAYFLKLSFPRIRYFFYIYYPLHLNLFWLIKACMR